MLTAFVNDFHLNFSNNNLYQYCGIPHWTDQCIQTSNQACHLQNDQEEADPHSQNHPSIIDCDKIYKMQLKIDYEDFNMQAKSWKELGKEVGFIGKDYVHWQTIKTAMKEFNYHKHKAHHDCFLEASTCYL